MNIQGKARAMKLRKVGKMTVGTCYFGFKKDKDNWSNLFLNCKFVGDAVKQAKDMKLKDKQDFVILDGILGGNTYTKDGKEITVPEITIFQIGLYEPKDNMTPIEDGADIPF